MGLTVKCGQGMRLRLGSDTFIYVDRAAKVLIEGPMSLLVQREYVAPNQGAFDDPREASYETLTERKRKKEAPSKDIAGGGDPEPG